MLTLVDSNVLLDVLSEDPTWESWSAQAIEQCAVDGHLCINAIIYAEVSTDFARIEDVNLALPEDFFRRLPMPLEAAFLAGKAYVNYRRHGGTRTCALPDFFIGAHFGGFREQMENVLLLSCTEANNRTQIDKLAEIMGGLL